MSRVVSKELTPLMRASAIGHLAAVKGLLNDGADVNVRGPRDSTALMFAVGAGHLEIVRELVHHGADIHAREEEGWTAVRLAKEDVYGDIVDYLQRASKPNHNSSKISRMAMRESQLECNVL